VCCVCVRGIFGVVCCPVVLYVSVLLCVGEGEGLRGRVCVSVLLYGYVCVWCSNRVCGMFVAVLCDVKMHSLIVQLYVCGCGCQARKLLLPAALLTN